MSANETSPISPSGSRRTPTSLEIKVWFIGPVLILLAAGLLSTRGERQVILPWVGQALPETCATRWQFGIDCPGCGLTRSFIYLAHGDITAAWKLHPVSLVLFLYVVFQLPLALAHWCHVQHPLVARITRVNGFGIIAIAVLLALRWMSRWFTGELL